MTLVVGRRTSIALVIGALAASMLTFAPPAAAQTNGDATILVLRTNAGDIVADLWPDTAPETVAQITALAQAGAYDGVRWFRVIPDFIAQVGLVETERRTPATAEQLALARNLPLELNDNDSHDRGVLSMARLDDPLSGTSSFSVVVADSPHLDGVYAPFGKVRDGMEIADAISVLQRDGNDRPIADAFVVSARVVDEAGLAAMNLNTDSPVVLPGQVVVTDAAGNTAAGNTVEQSRSVRSQGRDNNLVISLLASLLLAIAAFVTSSRVPARTTGAIALFSALAAAAGLMLQTDADAALLGALAAGVLFGVAAFVTSGMIDHRFSSALALLGAFGIGFGLYLEMVPTSSEYTGLIFFAGFFIFLRLLSRFEAVTASPTPAKATTTTDAPADPAVDLTAPSARAQATISAN